MKKFTDKTQLILDGVQAEEQSIVMQANRYNQAQGAKVGNACNKLKGSAKLYDQCVYGEIYDKKKNQGISEQRATADDVRGIKDTTGLIAFFKSLMKKKDDDEENGVNEQYASTVDRPRIAGPQSTSTGRTTATTRRLEREQRAREMTGRNIGISQRGANKGKRVADVAAPLPGTPEYDNDPEAYQTTQNALNVAGLAPVAGIPADLAAAGHSLKHGKYGDAAINLASTVPFVGELVGGLKIASAAAPLFGGMGKSAKNKAMAAARKRRQAQKAPEAPEAPKPKAPEAAPTGRIRRSETNPTPEQLAAAREKAVLQLQKRRAAADAKLGIGGKPGQVAGKVKGVLDKTPVIGKITRNPIKSAISTGVAVDLGNYIERQSDAATTGTRPEDVPGPLTYRMLKTAFKKVAGIEIPGAGDLIGSARNIFKNFTMPDEERKGRQLMDNSTNIIDWFRNNKNVITLTEDMTPEAWAKMTPESRRRILNDYPDLAQQGYTVSGYIDPNAADPSPPATAPSPPATASTPAPDQTPDAASTPATAPTDNPPMSINDIIKEIEGQDTFTPILKKTIDKARTASEGMPQLAALKKEMQAYKPNIPASPRRNIGNAPKYKKRVNTQGY